VAKALMVQALMHLVGVLLGVLAQMKWVASQQNSSSFLDRRGTTNHVQYRCLHQFFSASAYQPLQIFLRVGAPMVILQNPHLHHFHFHQYHYYFWLGLIYLRSKQAAQAHLVVFASPILAQVVRHQQADLQMYLYLYLLEELIDRWSLLF